MAIINPNLNHITNTISVFWLGPLGENRVTTYYFSLGLKLDRKFMTKDTLLVKCNMQYTCTTRVLLNTTVCTKPCAVCLPVCRVFRLDEKVPLCFCSP